MQLSPKQKRRAKRLGRTTIDERASGPAPRAERRDDDEAVLRESFGRQSITFDNNFLFSSSHLKLIYFTSLLKIANFNLYSR